MYFWNSRTFYLQHAIFSLTIYIELLSRGCSSSVLYFMLAVFVPPSLPAIYVHRIYILHYAALYIIILLARCIVLLYIFIFGIFIFVSLVSYCIVILVNACNCFYWLNLQTCHSSGYFQNSGNFQLVFCISGLLFSYIFDASMWSEGWLQYTCNSPVLFFNIGFLAVLEYFN